MLAMSNSVIISYMNDYDTKGDCIDGRATRLACLARDSIYMCAVNCQNCATVTVGGIAAQLTDMSRPIGCRPVDCRPWQLTDHSR